MSFHSRSFQGAVAYHAGCAAEDSVKRFYQDAGYWLCAERWRGAGGELDLVFRKDGAWIFVEVKKSRSFAQAMAMVTRAQLLRIFRSAEAFVGEMTGRADQNMRFDVALMDDMGRIEIVENPVI